MESEIPVLLSPRLLNSLRRFYSSDKDIETDFLALNPQPTSTADAFRRLTENKSKFKKPHCSNLKEGEMLGHHHRAH